MKRKSVALPSILILLGFLLSSCIGLIPLEEEPATGGFGPQVSLQEHQTQTLDALWSAIRENYIYYETADVDWDTLRAEYQRDVDAGLTAQEFEALLDELEVDLPENSLIYQTRAERIETDIADNATYEGIGAFIGFDPAPEPHIILLSVMGGSPAEKAGLKAHDSILAIDGSPILLEEGINAVQRVRGPSGSTVMLTVQSPGQAKRDVEVQRGRLAATVSLEAYQIVGTNYGYLLFPPLSYENIIEDLLAAMQAFTTNRRLEGLILDLRIAGSSGNWPLEELYTLFSNGTAGEFYNRSVKEAFSVQGQDYFSSQSVPLVILVGKNTQGFPEILAGGFQAQRRAVVIGDATNGEVESSTAFLLPDGSRIYIETTSFLLSNGDEIGLNGIQPDILIEAGWDEILPEQDPVLDAAILHLGSEQ